MENLKLFLTVLSLLMIIEGLPYFINPGLMRRVLFVVLNTDDRILRIMGLGIILTGLLILYLARSM